MLRRRKVRDKAPYRVDWAVRSDWEPESGQLVSSQVRA